MCIIEFATSSAIENGTFQIVKKGGVDTGVWINTVLSCFVAKLLIVNPCTQREGGREGGLICCTLFHNNVYMYRSTIVWIEIY